MMVQSNIAIERGTERIQMTTTRPFRCTSRGQIPLFLRINPATTRNADAVTSEGEERMARAATHDVCVGR
jgi:hypothetical protein